MQALPLSVIVTTHARPAFLARALQSLLAQTVQDFQIVVCADEPSPATKQVAAHFLRAQDVLVVVPQAHGPADTRNLGIQLAGGQNICFLDDDDSVPPGHVADLLAHLPAHAGELVYFNYQQVTELREGDHVTLLETKAVDTRTEDSEVLLVNNFVPNNAFVVGRALAGAVAFDRQLASLEDWDYLLALRPLVQFRHAALDGPNVHLAASPERRTVQSFQDGSVALDYLSIYRKWRATNDVQRRERSDLLARLGLQVSPAHL